jgi:MHS family proline/betaine transporter-like MFS transporter
VTDETTARPHDPPTHAPAVSRTNIVAAIFGNFLEHYDFVVFAVFASVISTQFFPADDPAAALLNTFAIYGVAFVGRPLGAVLFGRYGDRAGRRAALSAAVLLMVVATVVIGIAPTYEQVGVLAAVILFLARFAQGLSAGGEMAGAGSYLIEVAPPHRRALLTSWQSSSSSIGQVAASGLGALLAAVLSAEALGAWGWRVAFVIAAPLGVIGLWMRLRLEETPRFREVLAADRVIKAPVRELWVHHRRRLFTGMGVTVAWTISAYLYLAYMPTYLTSVVGLDLGTALALNTLAVLAYLPAIPYFARVADRRGRRPVLLAGCVATFVLTVPAFLLMGGGDVVLVFVASVLLLVSFALFAGTAPATLSELFPTRVRYTGVAVSYAVSVALFGGTAPFISTWLIGVIGSPLAPAAYMMTGSVVTFLVVLLAVREGAHEALPDDD